MIIPIFRKHWILSISDRRHVICPQLPFAKCNFHLKHPSSGQSNPPAMYLSLKLTSDNTVITLPWYGYFWVTAKFFILRKGYRRVPHSLEGWKLEDFNSILGVQKSSTRFRNHIFRKSCSCGVLCYSPWGMMKIGSWKVRGCRKALGLGPEQSPLD